MFVRIYLVHIYKKKLRSYLFSMKAQSDIIQVMVLDRSRVYTYSAVWRICTDIILIRIWIQDVKKFVRIQGEF